LANIKRKLVILSYLRSPIEGVNRTCGGERDPEDAGMLDADDGRSVDEVDAI